MKAKEIAKKATVEVIDWTPNGRVYQFTTEQLQEYAYALCKEQRESCLDRWANTRDSQIGEHLAIRNAPQPEAL